MKKIIYYLFIIILLCGCRDKKDLLNVSFPTSMAIDYQDGLYTVGFRIDNFNTVSKSDLETSSQSVQLLIAQEKGNSIEEAVNKIEQQERNIINFSHIRTLILLPGALDINVQDNICSFAALNSELRMDTTVYYSEESMDKIFTTNSQINHPELYAITNKPEFADISMMLESISLIQLYKANHDQNITITIPVLDLLTNENSYLTDEGTHEQVVYDVKSLLFMNGSQNQAKELPIEDLAGLSWTSSHQNKIDVNLMINEQNIHAYSTKVKAYSFFDPKTKTYHLKGTIEMILTRDIGFRSIDTLKPYLTQEIHQQIQHTYNTGLENHVDIYNLQYKSQLFGELEPLTEDNFIDEININTQIKGSYIPEN